MSNAAAIHDLFCDCLIYKKFKVSIYLNFEPTAKNLAQYFTMHLLQNSPDNRGMITLCDIMTL